MGFQYQRFNGDHKYFERIDGTACNNVWNPYAAAMIAIGNGGGDHSQRDILDGGFLELVRFGILPANDPKITDTLPEYDAVVSFVTPKGVG